MKNILVIAEGEIAQSFVTMIGKRRVSQNYYHIVSETITACENKDNKNILFYNIDPTSSIRLEKLFEVTMFSNVFIITDLVNDINQICHNINNIDSRTRIIVLNQWAEKKCKIDSSIATVMDVNDLISGHLYDNLPNVPKIAKNVGFGNGEIMEMHIPFGSSYAFRHIGSITQQKWKIVALYRNGKQILPTSATMIRPNDTILAVGNPMVLDGIYKIINKRKGFFPEPFGKNIFLLLDLKFDDKEALRYLEESMFMLEKMQDSKLFVLVVNPTNMDLVSNIKKFQSENLEIIVSFDKMNLEAYIEFQINQQESGMVLCTPKTFKNNQRNKIFYDLRKLVYIFGKNSIYNASKAFLSMKSEAKMESISSVVFDACETFGVPLKVSNFSSDNQMNDYSNIESHYEAMAPLFNTNIEFEYGVENQVRAISNMNNILEVSSYSRRQPRMGIAEIALAKGLDFLLTSNKHPKLLIPFETSDI